MEVADGIAGTTEGGRGVMPANDTREFEVEHDGDGQRHWIDVAVLCVVAAGASIDEIAASLATGNRAMDQDTVARVLADLERRQLLRAGSEREHAPLVPTERGRRMILDEVRTWTAAAA